MGIGYSFAILNIEFEKYWAWPELGFNEIESRNGSILTSISYDSRDNIFTPNRGFKVYKQFGLNRPWLGGTETYMSSTFYFHGFIPIAPGHVTGIRFDSRSTFGDPTFIYKPYIMMRGLPSMKYQDNNASLIELEQRIAIHKRWSVIAFGGLAKSYYSLTEFAEEELIYNYGTGFRYYLAKQYGLHMGLDFAWGPEDFAFYITFGSGWFRI